MAALTALLALLFAVVFEASRSALTESSERSRDAASREIAQRISRYLALAPMAASSFQQQIRCGVVDPRQPAAVESGLFALLLADARIGELTFTYAEQVGFDENGSIRLQPEPRGQVTVVRSVDGPADGLCWSRRVHQEDGKFAAERRALISAVNFATEPAVSDFGDGIVADPTTHLTFQTPAKKQFFGSFVWSDLHRSQIDETLPEEQRRAEVSVQQVLTDAGGKFAGVLRVGLLTEQLDREMKSNIAPAGTRDPHRIFLCDDYGRLVTRLAPEDRLYDSDIGLRVTPAHPPAEVVAALADPRLRQLTAGDPPISGRLSVGGEGFLTTFQPLTEEESQDWIVGIVAPRSYYLGALERTWNHLLAASFIIVAALTVGGAILLRRVRQAQALIVKESMKMKRFDFAPGPVDSAFRDVTEVLDGLEQAKAAMRTLAKYAPVDLVRRLYHEKSEPALGGEARELSIMFTDIKDFTSFSERLAPGVLAAALGRYLEAMTGTIQDQGGAIDKYIGDAIMALWNAPNLADGHARRACEAALRCRECGEALAASEDWAGLPAFETRFGVHLGSALVGHFGAPNRMNYTAIGDAVNLASRLEGLNKVYGTSIIVSESVYERAKADFQFRWLDVVAVKGKGEAIRIYELQGRAGEPSERRESNAVYERALAAGMARDFAGAAKLLEPCMADAAARVLLERCQRYLEEPPPDDWNGVHVFVSK